MALDREEDMHLGLGREEQLHMGLVREELKEYLLEGVSNV